VLEEVAEEKYSPLEKRHDKDLIGFFFATACYFIRVYEFYPFYSGSLRAFYTCPVDCYDVGVWL